MKIEIPTHRGCFVQCNIAILTVLVSRKWAGHTLTKEIADCISLQKQVTIVCETKLKTKILHRARGEGVPNQPPRAHCIAERVCALGSKLARASQA